VAVESRHRRVHVVMPESTVEAIDAIAGKRGRSQFITDTVEAELRRRRLSAALAEMDGALADFYIPGWETREAAAEWVRALRDGVPVPPVPNTGSESAA
jgi:metal-responsive CopG/Arc/MetJ family transcriptional regulator